MRLHRLLSGILLVFNIMGCAEVRTTASPDVLYKREMKININGQVSRGTIVAKKSPEYKISIDATGTLDLFTYQTCNREYTQEEAGSFLDGSKVSFKYVPVSEIETTRTCPIELAGYEKKRGRHSWGLIDFESEEFQLEARVVCNGKQSYPVGVSICQAKEGLIQEIQFPGDVVTAFTDTKCTMTTKDNRTFRFEMPRGACLFLYKSKGTGKMHKLTTFGYQEILIRGDF